jgi:hypothetical protein
MGIELTISEISVDRNENGVNTTRSADSFSAGPDIEPLLSVGRGV